MQHGALTPKSPVFHGNCHGCGRRLVVRLALPAAFSDMNGARVRERLADGIQGQNRVDVPLDGRHVGESFLQGYVYVRTVEVHQSAPSSTADH